MIKQIKSPNYSKGPSGHTPIGLILHIMSGTLKGTDAWFNNPKSQASAHYGIGKNGEIHQYVRELDTAWHAGGINKPSWSLLKPKINPNLYTIGIEHEGQPTDVWTDAMKQASSQLIKDICARWSIPIDRFHIVGHYEINSVTRANCPAIDKSIIDTLINLAKQL